MKHENKLIENQKNNMQIQLNLMMEKIDILEGKILMLILNRQMMMKKKKNKMKILQKLVVVQMI